MTVASATEIEDLCRALTEGSRWYRDDLDRDSRYGKQMVRDNAVRLLDTLQLADRFVTSARPRALECGTGMLYTIDALRWRYAERLNVYTIEHIPPTELPQMIRRLADCLADEGALLMSSPNSQAIWNVLSLAIGNGQMLDGAFPPERGFYGHIRMYARKEVEELLEYAGLELCGWRLTNWMHAHPWPGTPMRDRVRLGIQRTVPKVVPRWASGWICTGTSKASPRS